MISSIAKLLIILGISLAIFGVMVYLVAKIPGVGRLPGDIVISKKNLTFYFPLTTCLPRYTQNASSFRMGMKGVLRIFFRECLAIQGGV